MVGGTRAVSIDPDSEQSTSDLVLSKGNTKSNCNPFLIRESAAPQPSSPALRDRCCHLYLDRAVVVIDGMTVRRNRVIGPSGDRVKLRPQALGVQPTTDSESQTNCRVKNKY